jgi:hypothetical protein
VTVIEPGPEDGPTLLEQLVVASHLRLADLARELRRHPPTIGVAREVRRQLEHDLRAHLAVVDHVVRDDLYDVDRQVLQRDRDNLFRMLDRTRTAPGDEELGRAIARHVELEQGRLRVLRARLGPLRMAHLGYRYADENDARAN